ncbi:MAG: hypothetical protein OEO23_05580 [Gemmatimonadota bacterium]|nr:hypothetical protein [Gemmatimonadota bacterium]
MRKHILRTLLAPALLLLVACEQTPVDPLAVSPDEAVRVRSSAFLLETTNGQKALRWATPLAHDQTVSQLFTVDGAIWRMDNGLALGVPRGALDETTEITVTRKAGADVAFEFGPHGLHFNRPVAVRIRVSHLENASELEAVARSTDEKKVPLGSLQAVYYAQQDGELIEVIESFTVYLINGTWLHFETDHFSGYALAS